MESINISISKDYTITPGPRYEKEGKFSGELFRKNVLADKIRRAIQNNEIVQINLDGTAGYGTSFLEEIFGGLIRENGFKYENLKKVLKIISSEEPYLLEDIENDLLDAKEYALRRWQKIRLF